MSKPVQIASSVHLTELIRSTAVVVMDFYADWCVACRVIEPSFSSLSTIHSRPGRIAFGKINVDACQDLASQYNITSMPTFIVFRNGHPTETIIGADRHHLQRSVTEAVRYAQTVDEGGNAGAGSTSSSSMWLAMPTPRGFTELTGNVDIKELDYLNRDGEVGHARAIFIPGAPSTLAARGKGKETKPVGEGEQDWIESDTDEQLMLFVPFHSSPKLQSLQITSLPPTSSGDDDDASVMRPRTLKLFANKTRIVGFEDADDDEATQQIELGPDDWDAATGTARIELRYVKWQRISSLTIYMMDGDGDGERIRIDRLRFFGEPGEAREKGKLEKIGDETGE